MKPDHHPMALAAGAHSSRLMLLALAGLQATLVAEEGVADRHSTPPPSEWTVVAPIEVTSAHGQTLKTLDDKSVLASGKNPPKDDYVAVIEAKGLVRGLRLEALTHPSLSRQALSRANGNFVLTHVLVRQSGNLVSIASAEADYEQDGWPVAHALDDKPHTGWAVNGHQLLENRVAVFRFEPPIDLGEGGKLELELRHRSAHGRHNIGRFRISLTDSEAPSLGLEPPPPSTDLWQSIDLGKPGRPGRMEHLKKDDIFVIEGGGRDIAGARDQFHFAHRRLDGDGSLEAHVLGLQVTHDLAKAGLMIRERLAADAAFVMIAVTPSKLTFQWRSSQGAASESIEMAGSGDPHWVRLERRGDLFTALHSADGLTWSELAKATVEMEVAVSAGLAVTSHNNATYTTADFQAVKVVASAPLLQSVQRQ